MSCRPERQSSPGVDVPFIAQLASDFLHLCLFHRQLFGTLPEIFHRQFVFLCKLNHSSLEFLVFLVQSQLFSRTVLAVGCVTAGTAGFNSSDRFFASLGGIIIFVTKVSFVGGRGILIVGLLRGGLFLIVGTTSVVVVGGVRWVVRLLLAV